MRALGYKQVKEAFEKNPSLKICQICINKRYTIKNGNEVVGEITEATLEKCYMGDDSFLKSHSERWVNGKYSYWNHYYVSVNYPTNEVKEVKNETPAVEEVAVKTENVEAATEPQIVENVEAAIVEPAKQVVYNKSKNEIQRIKPTPAQSEIIKVLEANKDAVIVYYSSYRVRAILECPSQRIKKRINLATFKSMLINRFIASNKKFDSTSIQGYVLNPDFYTPNKEETEQANQCEEVSNDELDVQDSGITDIENHSKDFDYACKVISNSVNDYAKKIAAEMLYRNGNKAIEYFSDINDFVLVKKTIDYNDLSWSWHSIYDFSQLDTNIYKMKSQEEKERTKSQNEIIEDIVSEINFDGDIIAIDSIRCNWLDNVIDAVFNISYQQRIEKVEVKLSTNEEYPNKVDYEICLDKSVLFGYSSYRFTIIESFFYHFRERHKNTLLDAIETVPFHKSLIVNATQQSPCVLTGAFYYEDAGIGLFTSRLWREIRFLLHKIVYGYELQKNLIQNLIEDESRFFVSCKPFKEPNEYKTYSFYLIPTNQKKKKNDVFFEVFYDVKSDFKITSIVAHYWDYRDGCINFDNVKAFATIFQEGISFKPYLHVNSDHLGYEMSIIVDTSQKEEFEVRSSLIKSDFYGQEVERVKKLLLGVINVLYDLAL